MHVSPPDLLQIPAIRRLVDQGARRFVGATVDKLPIDPRTRALAKANDPSTWGTPTEVAACATPHIGVELAGDFTVVDLDGCVGGGAIAPPILALLEDLGGTVEVSTSGRGLHVFLDVPRDGRGRTDAMRGVEIYSTRRYILITGRIVRPATKTPAEQAQALRRLEDSLPPAPSDELTADLALVEASGGSNPRALMAWLHLRCGGAPSHLSLAQARDRLLRFVPEGQRHQRKAVDRSLELLCEAGFAERVTGRSPDGPCVYIRLLSRDKLATRFGAGAACRVAVPVAIARGLTPKRLFAIAVACSRNGRADRPEPMTRGVRQSLSTASRQTQYRAERQTGARVIPQLRRLKPGEGLPRERSHRLRIVDGRAYEYVSVGVELDAIPRKRPSKSRAASRPGAGNSGLQDSGTTRYLGAGERGQADRIRAQFAASGRPVPDCWRYVGRVVTGGRLVDLWEAA